MHARRSGFGGRCTEVQELVLRRFPSGDDAVYREAPRPGRDRGTRQAGSATARSRPRWRTEGLTSDPDDVVTGACLHHTPDDSCDAARQLGRALAHLHAHPAGPGLRTVLTAPAQHTTGVAASASAVAGLHLAWSRLATSAQVLTHNNFWSGNTLWAAGQLTGVVDWSGAGLAPRGFDLSWARLDLFLLHDRGVADAMTSAYETAAGLSVPDLDLWDVYAATNAHGGSRGGPRTTETWDDPTSAQPSYADASANGYCRPSPPMPASAGEPPRRWRWRAQSIVPTPF